MRPEMYTYVRKIAGVQVTDKTSRQPRCTNPSCGEVPISATSLRKLEQRAVALVLGQQKADGPAAVKCARKSLGLTQQELASLLGVKKETVSRWETGNQEPTMTDRRAIASLLYEVESGQTTVEGLRELIQQGPLEGAEEVEVRRSDLEEAS